MQRWRQELFGANFWQHVGAALLGLALSILVIVFLVQPLLAQNSEASRWDNQIRYFDASQYPNAVQAAVTQWNNAQVGVQFVAVPRNQAQLLIVSVPHRELVDGCPIKKESRKLCAGYATINRTRNARVTLPMDPDHTDSHPTVTNVELVVHELGHVLGLKHTARDCASMNPTDGMPECNMSPYLTKTRQLCGPLSQDIYRARKLYGVTNRFLPSPYCTPPNNELTKMPPYR